MISRAQHLNRYRRQLRAVVDRVGLPVFPGRQVSRLAELMYQAYLEGSTASADAVRWKFWRDGEGICVGDAPLCYLNGKEADQYTDDAIRSVTKQS